MEENNDTTSSAIQYTINLSHSIRRLTRQEDTSVISGLVVKLIKIRWEDYYSKLEHFPTRLSSCIKCIMDEGDLTNPLWMELKILQSKALKRHIVTFVIIQQRS